MRRYKEVAFQSSEFFGLGGGSACLGKVTCEHLIQKENIKYFINTFFVLLGIKMIILKIFLKNFKFK